MVEAAKGLRDFAKANPLLVIKGGVLDGKTMTPAEIDKLADLEPREVLLAKLAGAMKASMANAAATFAALPVQMARLAGALEAKLEAEGGATAQADAAPAEGAGRRGSRPTRRPPADDGGIRTDQAQPTHRTTSPRPPPPRTKTHQRRNDHHGEAQHRRPARRVQGDDAPRAVGVREAVRGDLRRQGRGPGRGGRRGARRRRRRPPRPRPRRRTSSTSSSRPRATRRSRSSRKSAR